MINNLIYLFIYLFQKLATYSVNEIKKFDKNGIY